MKRPRALLRACALATTAAVLTGIAACATQSLTAARGRFYEGRFAEANAQLARDLPAKSRVLYLMERGTIRLFLGDYANSVRDYIDAAAEIERLETYSVSQGGASMVVNDTVQNFRGVPYERTLVHAFAAIAHLAQGDWENSAVEARRIIISLSPEAKGDYPDDAFSRYMAGFCLEMIGDRSNAALQYQKASENAAGVPIDPPTGMLGGVPVPSGPELVCFVMMGRAPQGDALWQEEFTVEQAAYAEIVAEGRVLGRSYPLADTLDLAFSTSQKDAARKMVKTVTRIAVKESIAYQIEKDNELLGELVRFVLIGLLEQPDYRRWETLPRYLQVARVPCPEGMTGYTVVFRTGNGVELGRRDISSPIQWNGRTAVSFTRDAPAPAATAYSGSSGSLR